jgi:alpha-N-arabinofuranosidase
MKRMGCLALALGLLAGSAHAQGLPTTSDRAASQAPARSEVAASLGADRPGPVISRFLFGQFAEHIGSGIYGGLWVGRGSAIPNTRGIRNDVVAALRNLKVPLIRWPGGCYADQHHWRDGIGADRARRARINAYWGGVVEPNIFGTHEYFDLLDQVGAEAYVNGNVGTASPAETTEWIEYMTAVQGGLAEERARNGHAAPWKIAFWGIGNELWGCGGRMSADYAADLTRQYSQFIQVPVGKRPLLVASGADAADYNWTETMMRRTGERIDALALHYYTFPEGPGVPTSGTDFDETTYARTLAKTRDIDELLTRHSAIMDKYDPAKRVNLAVDEWGVLTSVVPGHPPESLYMQNSLRDALVAALNFNIFIRHADRVRMTAIAQMVNVAQSMILTDGPRMVLTPTYHVYAMYRDFQEATSLPVTLTSPTYRKDQWVVPAIDVVAAKGADGVVHVALTNVDVRNTVRVRIKLEGMKAGKVAGRLLTGAAVTSHNDFGTPKEVDQQAFTSARIAGDELSATLPPHSLVVLDLR